MPPAETGAVDRNRRHRHPRGGSCAQPAAPVALHRMPGSRPGRVSPFGASGFPCCGTAKRTVVVSVRFGSVQSLPIGGRGLKPPGSVDQPLENRSAAGEMVAAWWCRCGIPGARRGRNALRWGPAASGAVWREASRSSDGPVIQHAPPRIHPWARGGNDGPKVTAAINSAVR